MSAFEFLFLTAFLATCMAALWVTLYMFSKIGALPSRANPKPAPTPVALPVVPMVAVNLDEWREAWDPDQFAKREALRKVKEAEWEQISYRAFVERQDALRRAQERQALGAPLQADAIYSGGGLVRTGRSGRSGVDNRGHHQFNLDVAGLDAYFENMMDEVYLMHHTYPTCLNLDQRSEQGDADNAWGSSVAYVLSLGMN